MDRLDEAFTDLRLQDVPNILKTAKEYGIERSTLSRHWNGISQKKDLAYENQRLLTTTQSKALIQYINDLIERGIPSINAMVWNFTVIIIEWLLEPH